MRELLAGILPKQRSVTLRSDDHAAYPRAIASLGCDITHRITSSKERRDERNPLWEVNLLDLMIRHSTAAHKRETIAWAKRRQASIEKLAIFQVWRNYIKRRREKRKPCDVGDALGTCEPTVASEGSAGGSSSSMRRHACRIAGGTTIADAWKPRASSGQSALTSSRTRSSRASVRSGSTVQPPSRRNLPATTKKEGAAGGRQLLLFPLWRSSCTRLRKCIPPPRGTHGFELPYCVRARGCLHDPPASTNVPDDSGVSRSPMAEVLTAPPFASVSAPRHES